MADLLDHLRLFFARLRDRIQTLLPARLTGQGLPFIRSQRHFRTSHDELGTIALPHALAPAPGLLPFLVAGANGGYNCLLAESLRMEPLAFKLEPCVFCLQPRSLCLCPVPYVNIPATVDGDWGRASFHVTGTPGSLPEGISGPLPQDRRSVTTIPHAGLWLLDCEGAEPHDLPGAQELLRATHPLLLPELAPGRNPEALCHRRAHLLSAGSNDLLPSVSLFEAPPFCRLLAPDAVVVPLCHDIVLVVVEAPHQPFIERLPPGAETGRRRSE